MTFCEIILYHVDFFSYIHRPRTRPDALAYVVINHEWKNLYIYFYINFYIILLSYPTIIFKATPFVCLLVCGFVGIVALFVISPTLLGVGLLYGTIQYHLKIS